MSRPDSVIRRQCNKMISASKLICYIDIYYVLYRLYNIESAGFFIKSRNGACKMCAKTSKASSTQ